MTTATSAISFPDFRRNVGRRKEDRLIRDLLNVSQIITSEINMDVLFRTIIEETNHMMEVERCTIFVSDNKSHELWYLNSSRLVKNDVNLPPSHGIAGWVFTHKTPLIVNDPDNEPRFCREVDNIFPFNARGILGVPLINRHRQCIGVYQAFNKKAPDGQHAEFTQDDLDLFVALSSFVVIAIENSKLYEEVKLLDKAKERTINHIGHELKTPLALISRALDELRKRLSEGNMAGIEKSIEMGQRNVNRLLQLQLKIDDILQEKLFNEKPLIMNIIDDAFGSLETLKDQSISYREIPERVSKYIESFYSLPTVYVEKIALDDLLKKVTESAMQMATGRVIHIETDFEKGISLYMDRNILEKTCAGLLKNAIENTPDEGKIEVSSRKSNDGVSIAFRDYGVGITQENQKMIFGGFYHTQDTCFYATKKPYEFNAGGNGLDLLRIKVFSERCRFTIDFSSTRCKLIPADSDLCPGRISNCTHIQAASECFSSGGSTFALKFGPVFESRSPLLR